MTKTENWDNVYGLVARIVEVLDQNKTITSITKKMVGPPHSLVLVYVLEFQE